MSNIVKTDKFIKTDVNQNRNKYWYITLYDDNSVKTEFGRVGYSSQTSEKPFSSMSKAEEYYNKKCKEKQSARNGEIPYRKLNVIDGSTTTTSVTSSPVLEKLVEEQIELDGSDDLKELMKQLVKQNIHSITSNSNITVTNGVLSTPCGIVTKESITEARLKLIDISTGITDNKYDDKVFRNTLNDYLMLVPQNCGRKLDPRSIFSSQEDVLKQTALLDAMDAAVVTAVVIINDRVFNVKLSKITDKPIIKEIEKFFFSTKNNIHSCRDLKPKRVYSICITSMNELYGNVEKKIGNIKRLWHGTRVCNVLSIMKQGLVIPPSNASHCTGRMFGDGIYFSDQSTKSLNYSYGYWSGSHDDNCFMFLADVAMGREYIPSTGWGKNYPLSGYDSTFAKAGQSGVMNNEMIVYNTNQCALRYLIEFSK